MRLFSDLKVIADFGLAMGIALSAAFLADVLPAPALLRIFYGFRQTDSSKQFDMPRALKILK
jgi:predicted RND superfamily exporter protein